MARARLPSTARHGARPAAHPLIRRAATSSMTSVPKPLKFLRPNYETLKAQLEGLAPGAPNRQALADVVRGRLGCRAVRRPWPAMPAPLCGRCAGGARVARRWAWRAAAPTHAFRRRRRRRRCPCPCPCQVSVLAMTSSEEGSRETLKYKLQGAPGDVARWGHEYVRHLAGEIGEAWEERRAQDAPLDDLQRLVDQIVPYQMSHNAGAPAGLQATAAGRGWAVAPALRGRCVGPRRRRHARRVRASTPACARAAEPEAVDLLLEVERISLLEAHADDKNFQVGVPAVLGWRVCSAGESSTSGGGPSAGLAGGTANPPAPPCPLLPRASAACCSAPACTCWVATPTWQSPRTRPCCAQPSTSMPRCVL